MEEKNNLSDDYNSSGTDKFRYPQKEVKSITNRAFATGYKNKLTNRTTLNSYIIGQDYKKENQTKTLNQYLNPTSTTLESVDQNQLDKANSYLGNLELINKKSINEEFHFMFNLEDSKSKRFSDLNTTVDSTIAFINNKFRNNEITASSQMAWYKKYNATFIGQFNASINNVETKDNDIYKSNNPFFEGIISFENPTENYVVSQLTNRNLTTFTVSTKNYINLNKNSTISLEVGTIVKNDKFKSNIFEVIPDSLNKDIARNDLSIEQFDLYLKPGYLYKKNKITIETSLNTVYRKLENNLEFLVSPFIKAEYKKSFGNEISISYQYQNEKPTTNYFYTNKIIRSYNTVFLGNTDLKSKKYHEIKLNANYADLSEGITAYGTIDFLSYDRSILFQTNYTNQNSTTKPINTEENKKELFARATIGKVFQVFKINFTPFYSYTKQPQINNGIYSENQYGYTSFKIKTGTIFDNFPNLEISYTKGFKNFNSPYLKKHFQTDAATITISHFNGPLKYSAYYRFYRTSDSFNDEISNLGFNTSYDFKNSPWRISLKGENLLNDTTSSQTILGETFISEREINRLQSVILFGIAYKF